MIRRHKKTQRLTTLAEAKRVNPWVISKISRHESYSTHATCLNLFGSFQESFGFIPPQSTECRLLQGILSERKYSVKGMLVIA